MQEEVGNCQECGKKIYCLDGFLNGILKPSGDITCFDCDFKKTKSEMNQGANDTKKE